MKTNSQKKPIITESLERDFEKTKLQLGKEAVEKMPFSSESINKSGNFSSLNFDKLNTSYADQDKSKLEAIRQQMTPEQLKEQAKVQFFKKYKQEEEDYYEKRKRRHEEKKLQEERITVEKIRQQEEENLKSHTGDIPKGKVKKNIFGKTNLKANTALPPEIRPGQGKQ